MTCSSLTFSKIRTQNLWFLPYVLMYCAVTPVRLHFNIGTSLGTEASPLRRQTTPLPATARRHWGTPLEEAPKRADPNNALALWTGAGHRQWYCNRDRVTCTTQYRLLTRTCFVFPTTVDLSPDLKQDVLYSARILAGEIFKR